LVSATRSGASPAARGTENAADCPAAKTVSNCSSASFSLTPGCLANHHAEAVGLVAVVDQGREAFTELYFIPSSERTTLLRRRFRPAAIRLLDTTRAYALEKLEENGELQASAGETRS
jgi:hypothetical protein